MSQSPSLPDTQRTTQLTPEALVDEFKRQGHFDQIRKQIFQEFQQSPQLPVFLQQAENAMMHYAEKDSDRLVFRDARLRHSDFMRELDRNPLLDRLVEELSGAKEPTDSSNESGPLLGAEGRVARQVRQQLAQMARPPEA